MITGPERWQLLRLTMWSFMQDADSDDSNLDLGEEVVGTDIEDSDWEYNHEDDPAPSPPTPGGGVGGGVGLIGDVHILLVKI